MPQFTSKISKYLFGSQSSFDFRVGIFPFLCFLLIWGILNTFPQAFYGIFFFDIWFLSHPHAISTFFQPKARSHFKILPFFLFSIFLAGLWLVERHWGFSTIFNIYFYWQWFHYIRQNYGIAASALAPAKSGEKRSVWSLFYILHGMPIIALLIFILKGPHNFMGYYLWDFGIRNYFLLNLEQISGTLWSVGYVVAIFFLGHFLHKRETIKGKNALIVYLSLILYYLVYVWSEQFIYAWLAMTFYHNIQYLFFNYEKVELKKEVSLKKISLSFQMRTGIFFYLAALFISTLIYGIAVGLPTLLTKVPFTLYFPSSVILIFSLNMVHYTYDTFIWKGMGRSSAVQTVDTNQVMGNLEM